MRLIPPRKRPCSAFFSRGSIEHNQVSVLHTLSRQPLFRHLPVFLQSVGHDGTDGRCRDNHRNGIPQIRFVCRLVTVAGRFLAHQPVNIPHAYLCPLRVVVQHVPLIQVHRLILPSYILQPEIHLLLGSRPFGIHTGIDNVVRQCHHARSPACLGHRPTLFHGVVYHQHTAFLPGSHQLASATARHRPASQKVIQRGTRLVQQFGQHQCCNHPASWYAHYQLHVLRNLPQVPAQRVRKVLITLVHHRYTVISLYRYYFHSSRFSSSHSFGSLSLQLPCPKCSTYGSMPVT